MSSPGEVDASASPPMQDLLRDALDEEERRLSDLEARVQALVARAGGAPTNGDGNGDGASPLEAPRPSGFAELDALNEPAVPAANSDQRRPSEELAIGDDLRETWCDARPEDAAPLPEEPRPRGFAAPAHDPFQEDPEEDTSATYTGQAFREDPSEGEDDDDANPFRAARRTVPLFEHELDPPRPRGFREAAEPPAGGPSADDSGGWRALEDALEGDVEDSGEDQPLIGLPPGAWDRAKDAELDATTLKFRADPEWAELSEATAGVVEDALAGVVEDDVDTEETLALPRGRRRAGDDSSEEAAPFREPPSWSDLSPALPDEPRPRGFARQRPERRAFIQAPRSAPQTWIDPHDEALVSEARRLVGETGAELGELERRLEALAAAPPTPTPATAPVDPGPWSEAEPFRDDGLDQATLPPDPRPRGFADQPDPGRHELGRAFGAGPSLDRLSATLERLAARVDALEEAPAPSAGCELAERLERRLNALEDRLEEALEDREAPAGAPEASVEEQEAQQAERAAQATREAELEARAARAEERFYETVRQLSQTTELVGRLTARLEALTQAGPQQPPPALAEPGTTQHLIRLLRSGPVHTGAVPRVPEASGELPRADDGQARLLEAVDDHRDLLREHARLLDRLVRRLD
jgi:Skp family chaperone for outer membrane proteins